MEIPEGYVHKATSDSFNLGESVSIWYNSVEDDYFIMMETLIAEPQEMFFTKAQLELFVQSATDVLDMV